jgi:hypothetical protein
MSVRSWARAAVGVAALATAAAAAPGQPIADLERERPLSLEDARPIVYPGFSVAADFTTNVREEDPDDFGPGLSLRYGAARRLELGAGMRWVTNPETSADRGIRSGDLRVHALYRAFEESATAPAIAFRADLIFPTGLDSRGTDLELSAIATRSFQAARVHVNLRWERLGDALPAEVADRWYFGIGTDFLPPGHGTTNLLLAAAATLRSSALTEGKTNLGLESGLRWRIGMGTVLFGFAGSEFTGDDARAVLSLRVGATHQF